MNKTSPTKDLFDVGWLMAGWLSFSGSQPSSHLSLPDKEQRIAISQLVQMLPRTSRYLLVSENSKTCPLLTKPLLSASGIVPILIRVLLV